jgi:hypothetical protein
VIEMDREPGGEFGQQQVPALPAGAASLPEDAPVGGLRRPSRRRRLLVAGVVLVGVILVVGAGVLLAPGQPPSGGRVTTTAAAAQTTSPAGSAEANSKDFGRVPRGGLLDRFDASVFLAYRVDPAQQDMIRRRVAALPVVEAFAYESPAEAFKRFRVLFRYRPDLLRGATEQTLPASFRVVLHDPSQFRELFREFCPRPGPDGKPDCLEGVEVVVDQHQIAWNVLAGPWLHTTDAAVFLASDVDPDRRKAIRADLEALPVVEQVDFESKAAARRRLQQADVTAPLALHDLVLDSFRVRLSVPARFAELYGLLCSGRWSFSTAPVCKPGVRVVIANPNSVYYGLPR